MEKITKGKLAQTIVIKFLLKEEWEIYEPITENTKTDLIIRKNNKTIFLQIKSVQVDRHQLVIPVRKLNHNKTTHKTYLYSEEDADFIVGVDLQSEEIYFVPYSYYRNYTSAMAVSKLKSFLNNLNGAL